MKITEPNSIDLFLLWISRKIQSHIHLSDRRVEKNPTKGGYQEFKEGAIWWCMLGQNLGVEVFGKGEYFTRPVLILKKLGRYSFIGIPTSTKTEKKDSRRYYGPMIVDGENPSIFLFDQIGTLDSSRLTMKIRELPSHRMTEIREKFISFLR